MRFKAFVLALLFAAPLAAQDKKISQLPDGATPQAADTLPIARPSCPGGNCRLTIGSIAGKTILFCSNKRGVCNGVTDDTAALNAAIVDLYDAGGGTLVIDGTVLISGAVLLPNDGVIHEPRQPAIRITGTGYAVSGLLRSGAPLPVHLGTLDMRYNASIAKIDTRGAGVLEIDSLVLLDGGSDCAPFIHTTSTLLRIHDVTFRGTGYAATACNDGIILGGTQSKTGEQVDGSETDPFSGYGTTIERNYFDRMRRAVVVQVFGNAIAIRDNYIQVGCGNPTGAAIHFAVPNAQGCAYGNLVEGNIIEVPDYLYGIHLGGNCARDNVIIGNECWDGDGTTTACVRFDSSSIDNILISGYWINAGAAYSDGNATPSNVILDQHGSLQMYGARVSGVVSTSSILPSPTSFGAAGLAPEAGMTGQFRSGASTTVGIKAETTAQFGAFQFDAASSTVGNLYGIGATYSTTGRYIAGSMLLEGGQAGGVTVAAMQANGPVRIWSKGTSSITFNGLIATLDPIAQGSLGTPANGSIAYCSDCNIANPCTGGGTGALAKRLNGAWVCN
jgi:hypothetical protein